MTNIKQFIHIPKIGFEKSGFYIHFLHFSLVTVIVAYFSYIIKMKMIADSDPGFIFIFYLIVIKVTFTFKLIVKTICKMNQFSKRKIVE